MSLCTRIKNFFGYGREVSQPASNDLQEKAEVDRASFFKGCGSYLWQGISKVGKFFYSIDKKTLKVAPSIVHITKAAQAKSIKESLLGAIEFARGTAMGTALGAYIKLLVGKVPIEELAKGIVSLKESGIPLSKYLLAINFTANTLLELSSFLKSIYFKNNPEELEKGRLSLHQMMSGKFIERLVDISPHQREKTESFFKNGAISSAFLFAVFLTLTVLAYGELATPLTLMLGSAGGTVARVAKYFWSQSQVQSLERLPHPSSLAQIPHLSPSISSTTICSSPSSGSSDLNSPVSPSSPSSFDPDFGLKNVASVYNLEEGSSPSLRDVASAYETLDPSGSHKIDVLA